MAFNELNSKTPQINTDKHPRKSVFIGGKTEEPHGFKAFAPGILYWNME